MTTSLSTEQRASLGPGREPGGARANHSPAGPVAGAVALGLVGAVAALARGTPAWAPLRVGRADRMQLMAEVAVLGFVVVAAALAVALLIHRTWIAGRPGSPPLRTTLLRALPAATLALAVLGLMSIARADLDGRAAGPRSEQIHGGEAGSRPPVRGISDSRWTPVVAGEDTREADASDGEPEPAGNPSPWLLVLGAAAVLVAGAAVRSWLGGRSGRRSRPGHEHRPDPRRAALHGAVIGTIDAMLADPDPRTAIIGAYARLLEGLEACGIGRREHEGPMEHLHRALTGLRVAPGPLRRLIALFEVARFSTHALTPSHREEALDALRVVAGDLGVAAPAPERVGSRPGGAAP